MKLLDEIMDDAMNKRLERGETSKQSLQAVMNDFVEAVNVMDDTVMVPCKLKDMHLPLSNNTQTDKAIIPIQNADMYGFYTMLNGVKSELIMGPDSVEENTSSVHVDEQSKKSAAAFRYHIQGLFSVLKNLTDAAKVLTTTYQQETSDISVQNGQTTNVAQFSL